MSTRGKSKPVIARRIRFLRGKQTQEEFSARVGISRSALANYETGRSIPNEFAIAQIVQKTGVSEGYFNDPSLPDEGDLASVVGGLIEGRPDWTDEEEAIVRVLRVCPKPTVLLVINTLLKSVATQELTTMLGNITTLEEDIEHLVLIQQRGGQFKKGMSWIDGDTLIRKLAQSKENN